MAKEHKRLSRENVQGFLEKTSDTGVIDGEALKEVTKARKRGFAGTLAAGGATLAGKMAKGANTLGGTLVEGVKSEIGHGDFAVRAKSFGIGLLACAIVLVFMLFVPWVQPLDNMPYDWKQKFRFEPTPMSGSIVHLDLDDQTIASVGRWPWPRSRWAGFVRACKEAGVRHTVFDIEFFQGQQEEVDPSAFNRFKHWGAEELPHKVGANLKTWTQSLGIQLAEADSAKQELEAATSSDASEAARIRLARALAEIKRLRDLMSSSGIGEDLLNEFDEFAKAVVVDHDGLFAEAVAEAGNVVLPMHFDKSTLIQANSGRPAVSKELFERYEAYLDREFPRDLHRSGRESVGLALLGATVVDPSTGKTITLDEGLAAKYQEETYTTMRSLYLYRMVRKWYSTKDEATIRADMAAYVADWTGFVGSMFGSGMLFERLSGAYDDLKFAHEWVSQAAEQLQRFYGWIRVSRGNGANGQPWCYPITVIQGYDPSIYDPWKPIAAGEGHSSGSHIFHYRDTGFVPAIYRLLNGAQNVGFVSIEHDDDGTVRGVPLFIVYEETFSGERVVMPQLAFQSLLLDVAADPKSLKIVPGKYVEFRAVEEIASALRSGEPLTNEAWEAARARASQPGQMATFRIKVDDRCMMRINWVGGDNPAFPEVFAHVPVSRLIAISTTQDELRRNDSSFHRAITSPELTFGDAITYANNGGVARYYGQPPVQLASVLGSDLAAASLKSRNEIRQWVASEIQASLSYRLTRTSQPDRLAAYAMVEGEERSALLAAFAAADKEEDAKRLGEFLIKFKKVVLEAFREGDERPSEGSHSPATVDALVKAGLSVEIATKIADGFVGVDGSPVADFTKLPRGLANAAAQDFSNPFRSFARGVDRATKLSPVQRDQIYVHLFDATSRVASLGDQFEKAVEAIERIVSEAYGAPYDAMPEELNKELATFRSTGPGKVITSGRAFRQLLWSTELPFGEAEVKAARLEGSDPLVMARATRRMLWEVPLWVASGMMPATDPLAESVKAASAHAWVLEGPRSKSVVPEELRELSARLLTAEEPFAAIIARRINSFYFKYSDAGSRFEAAVEKDVSVIRNLVSDRFALAGWAATGAGDIIVTSNSKSIPGPALHSNTYNTALYSIEPVKAPLWTAIIAMVAGAGVCLAAARFTVKWGIGTLVGVLVAWVLIDNWVYSDSSVTMLTLTAIAPWLGAFLSIQVYRYAVEYRAKLKIKGQFGKFLSQEAVEELQKNPDMLKLGGDEKELCVLFSDIAGFTPISESMSASRLIDFLNDYMGRMCASIKDSKGYVDKFIGDAIMAIWGAPVPVPDYSARAVKTAVRNTQSLAAWNRERKERGELEVGARIGLATGPMVAGNMGTEWKLNYTCIGDTVNLGARLEGANKQYGTQIMINELCYEQSKDVIVAHIMDKIAVKGKKKGLPVYHVVGLVGETEPRYTKGCELYTKGFELYQQEKWAEAIPFFKESKENLPPPYQVKEGPYDLMIERCEALMNATPEERMEILHLKSVDDEWDGVWKLTSK